MRDAGTPRPITVHTCAGSLANKNIGARHNPIERGVIVKNAFDQAAKIGEQLTDLFLPGSETPLRKEDLGILCEQVENAGASRCDTFVVKGLQIFQSN